MRASRAISGLISFMLNRRRPGFTLLALKWICWKRGAVENGYPCRTSPSLTAEWGPLYRVPVSKCWWFAVTRKATGLGGRRMLPIDLDSIRSIWRYSLLPGLCLFLVNLFFMPIYCLHRIQVVGISQTPFIWVLCKQGIESILSVPWTFLISYALGFWIILTCKFALYQVQKEKFYWATKLTKN